MSTNIINLCKKNIQIISFSILLLLILNSYNILWLEIFFYVLLHILFVYWTIHDQKINYFIVFIIAFVLDLFLVSNFGPHLITFLIIFFIIKKLNKLLKNIEEILILLQHFILTFIMLFLEHILAIYLYDQVFNISILIKYLIVLICIIFPTYKILNRIS